MQKKVVAGPTENLTRIVGFRVHNHGTAFGASSVCGLS